MATEQQTHIEDTHAKASKPEELKPKESQPEQGANAQANTQVNAQANTQVKLSALTSSTPATAQRSETPVSETPVSAATKMLAPQPQTSVTRVSQSASSQSAQPVQAGPTAIVGISGRYPGAENLAQYWQNLVNGVDSVTEIPDIRWNIDEHYSSNKIAPGKVHAATLARSTILNTSMPCSL